MRPLPPLPSRRDPRAPTRALASLAASLAVVVALFLGWPPLEPAAPPRPLPAPPAPEMLVLEPAPATTQPDPGRLPPAPPPPPDAPPVEVPDDVVLREALERVDVPRLDLPPEPARPAAAPLPGPPTPPAPGRPPPGPPGPGASPAPPAGPARLVEAPERSPRVVRQALPAYPAEARRAGVRGRARVRVLVSEGGQPTEPQIVERVRLDGRGRAEPVDALPPAVEQAMLEAARRSLFRPATDGGERVRAYAVLVFEVGTD